MQPQEADLKLLQNAPVMVSSCLQGEPRKKELVPEAGRMRVRYEEEHPASEKRHSLEGGCGIPSHEAFLPRRHMFER